MQLFSFALFEMLYSIATTFLIKYSKHDPRKYFNLSQSSVAFHIKTSHLHCKSNDWFVYEMQHSTWRILVNGWV